ncbi:MAG: EAL domain-containing response regulator [Holophaga sp.]|nr:EAL domain-containing response regulator [Holophaga sp.]
MSNIEKLDGLGASVESAGILGRKVLVIEDSWTQRSHAVSLVRSLGASEVLEVSDGVEALRILEEEPGIDLVFCDLEMPRMDGVAMIGEMAARNLTPHLIILSSQEPGLLDSVKAMAVSYGLSCLGVIAKPLSRENLAKIFSTTLLQDGVGGTLPHSPFRRMTLPEIQAGMDRGEFEVFFQPLVSMQSASLKGVEALVRWRHPDLGLLSPGAFLPQAEEDAEVMSLLTLQILERIARRWNGWKQDGLEVELSVNLSAASLGTKGFADRILDTVASHDMVPKRMILEITESASISNLGHTLANLARLRMRGFRLSIDDFGTGYATYEQLQRIPWTELKIDMSITRELPKSRKHAILARNVLRLAKDLRLHTVAEGIETQETWNILKSYGCDCGQGYFLARPMPGDQLREWSTRDRSHL